MNHQATGGVPAGSGGTAAFGTGGRLGSGGSTATGGAKGSGGVGSSGAVGGRDGIGSGGVTGGGSGGSGSGGTAATVYRPFSDSSPWNTPIGSSPVVDPDSAALIDDLASSTTNWNYLNVNITDYSIPVYYIDSNSTPTYSVKAGLAGHGFDKPVPIPDGAMPDPQGDHHLCMVDKAKGIEWGMWNTTHNSDGSWSAGVGASADLTGTGVRPPITTANPWTDAMGSRASGFPLIAGLIRTDEIKAGKIRHALMFAYPHCRSRYFVPPASTAQGTTTDALPTRGIPMGGRIQLDPSIDVDSLSLSAAGKVIAHALQDYGAFVGDYSGSISVYAENAPDARAYWASGVLQDQDLRTVFDQTMLKRFRVLAIGTLLDNDN